MMYNKIILFILFCTAISCKKDSPALSSPVATFTYSITNSGTLPTTVNFTSSSQNAETYIWDFGDGSTSTLQSPQHTYSSINTFDVTLTVSNSSGSNSSTQKIKITYSSPPISQVDDAVSTFMATYAIPGISIAITKDEKLVYVKSYGKADQASSTDVSSASLFRIASVSKPITAVAIIKLVEDGKLSLNQKVFGTGAIFENTYGTPPYSSDISDITVQHLLQHTCGGWSNDANDPMFSNSSMTPQELISWTLDNRPLANSPGTTYAYSNFGYCVLGRIIEKITGENYEQWVKNNILKPGGITAMQMGGNTFADKKTNEVIYYGQNGEDPYLYNISRMDAHGAWLSTAVDLARLLVRTDGFNAKTDLLNSSSITTMITPSSANANYACGWAVNTYNNWWHLGSLPGTATQIVRTSGGFCWVILCNTRSNAANFYTDLDALIWLAVNNSATQWPSVDLF